MADDDAAAQDRVDEYFDCVAPYWRDIYLGQGVEGVGYELRMETALVWIDESTTPGDSALDVGCGAGRFSVELARRGLVVEAVDGSSSMLAIAGKTVADAGVAERVTVRQADVHRLPYADDSFAVVVALGVLPWLHTPELAVREMARVLEPGGLLVLTADNRARLNWLTEPRENPLASPIKHVRRRLRGDRAATGIGAPSRLHRPRRIDLMLVGEGLLPTRRRTVGFGPFTFFGRPVFPRTFALRLQRGLQALADRELPGVRSAGWHYTVAARKVAPSTAVPKTTDSQP